MDDDNISAAITHGGGGGITLHSRWKSQFDDSEGCSDNETEMKGEQLQSPEHIKQEVETKEEIPSGGGAPNAEKRSPMPKENPPKPPTLNLSPSPNPNPTSSSLMSPNLSKGMMNRPPQYITQHSVPGNTNTATVATTPNVAEKRSPMPKENPPKPPTLNLELQHSASAPSMKQLSPPTSLPPPPQFRPPPPPATVALSNLYSTATVSSATSSTAGKQINQTPQPHVTVTTGSSTTNNGGSSGILSKRLLPQTGGQDQGPDRICDPEDNATHDPNEEEEEEEEEDCDDENEDEDDNDEEEEDEDEDGGGEVKEGYVAAVCHYTTILKDAPPGFDNDDYEVNYHHLNEQDVTTEDNDGGAANDHTSPGQNWSSPQINRTSNFVFTQKEGFRLRASAKVDEPVTPAGAQTAAGFKLRLSSDTDNSRSRPVVRSTSSDRILDSSGDYAHQESGVARSYTQSTQDESSDVPQAVFIRPPARMRIFQTEVEDDEDDADQDEEDEEDDNEAVEEEDDEPPVPPPRSKSKESSLSTGPMASRHRSKDVDVEASRSPNERSVYFDAMDQHGVSVPAQCHGDQSSATSSAAVQRRSTPADQNRSLGSFRESKNDVEKKEIVKLHHSEVASSGGDSCSRSCSDHSNNKQHPQSSSSGRRGTRSSRKHQPKSGSSSRGESSHHGARRISLDDLSSAFQALISNSSAAVAASMSKKKSNHSSRASTKSLMNRSFVQPAITNDCCQSDNGGLGDHSRGSPAERMRSRSEENLLESRSAGSIALSHSNRGYDDRGISCSPASLKQSISIRSSNDSSAGSGRLNLSSRYYILSVTRPFHLGGNFPPFGVQKVENI